MYPPRDRPQDVHAPPDEFKTAVFFGLLWFGLGALAAALASSLDRALYAWAMAAACGLNACLIQSRVRRTARIPIVLGFYGAVVAGVVAGYTALS